MNNTQIVEYTRKILTEGIASKTKKNDKPKNTEPKEIETTGVTHITNNITVSPNNRLEILLILLFIFIYPFLEYIKPTAALREEQIKYSIHRLQSKYISISDILEFQELIKAVAQKEHISVHTLHNELKKTYNYKRYREISPELFIQIKNNLENRLSQQEPSDQADEQ